MVSDKQELCCDISDSDNPMCWGCYSVWYEIEKNKYPEEEFFMNGEINDNHS